MATSVIILVVDEFRVAVLERESQPPVSADTHAPVVRKPEVADVGAERRIKAALPKARIVRP